MAYVKNLSCTRHTHIRNLVDYVLDKSKNANGTFVTCEGCQADTIVWDFETVRCKFNKNSGVMAHQMIQSFKRGEVNPQQAHELANELAKRTLTGYQYMVVTHIDAENNINSHIVFNSVSYLTGGKYHSNKNSLAILRKASDEICIENGLDIIIEKDHLKGIDKKTYDAAMQGRSWKVELANDLDGLLKSAKSKQELLDGLKKKGYTIKEMTKHITVTKQGHEKGIRLDTLAKQFGSKYTKNNIERHFEGFGIDEKEAMKKNVQADDSKSEWQKYERYYFKNNESNERKTVMGANVKLMLKLKRSIENSKSVSLFAIRNLIFIFMFLNKKNRTEYKAFKNYLKNKRYSIASRKKQFERAVGNVSYEDITKSYGETVTLKIPVSKLIYFAKLNIFYSGVIKQDGTVFVTFKKSNQPIINKVLNIDVDKIKDAKQSRQERMQYKEIQNKAKERKEKLLSYKVSYEDVLKLDSAEYVFSVRQNEKDYTVSFFESDLKGICITLDKNYLEEKIVFESRQNNKIYQELKHSQKNHDDKILYRVVDKIYFEKIREHLNFNIACFEKEGGKCNIAFSETNLPAYEKIIANEKEKEIQRQVQMEEEKQQKGKKHTFSL